MYAVRFVAPARSTIVRATPALGRFYSPDSRQEGATATSQGFSKREQAEEGQYIKKREAEQLKAAREKLAAAQKEVDQLEKKATEKK